MILNIEEPLKIIHKKSVKFGNAEDIGEFSESSFSGVVVLNCSEVNYKYVSDKKVEIALLDFSLEVWMRVKGERQEKI